MTEEMIRGLRVIDDIGERDGVSKSCNLQNECLPPNQSQKSILSAYPLVFLFASNCQCNPICSS